MDDEELDDLDEHNLAAVSSSREFDVNYVNLEDDDFDDVDRVTDSNQLMENTMLLIANATELQENQYPLIEQSNPMMRLIVMLAQQLLTHVARSGEELPLSML